MLFLDLNFSLNTENPDSDLWFLLVYAGHDHFLSHPCLYIIHSLPAIQPP